jgi:hypothetical protein
VILVAVAALVSLAAIVVVRRWLAHEHERHVALRDALDARIARLHGDVDFLLDGLADMEAARPLLECEVLVTENLA